MLVAVIWHSRPFLPLENRPPEPQRRITSSSIATSYSMPIFMVSYSILSVWIWASKSQIVSFESEHSFYT